MNRKRSIRTSAGGLALVLATLVACTGPALRDASAQASSATRRLTFGGMIGAGDSSHTAAHALVGQTGGAPGSGRGSSATRDGVPGIVGGVYSSLATTQVATSANKYAGVAFPVTAAVSTVTGIFDELGAYDNTKWRLGHWSPADSAYMEPGPAGALNLANISAGQGYWLITKGAEIVAATGLPVPAEPFRIPILGTTVAPPQPRAAAWGAWNQIGNPFLFPVDVSALQVTDGTTTANFNTNTWTEHGVKGWDPGTSAYVDVTVLNARTAYWVRKLNGISADIALILPYQASAAGSTQPALAKPAGADWAVAITARQGDRSCEPMLVGAAGHAPGSRNPLNSSRAPAPPGGAFLSLHLPRSEWGGDYVRVFQPQADHMSWDFVAAGGEVPGEMALAIAGFDLPAGTQLSLTDIAAGTTRAVTPGETVTIAATAAPRALRLEAVAAGASGPAPTIVHDALRYAYPNPFASSMGLTFALSSVGDIHVDIFDLLGRRVRQLERVAQGPGEHVLVWDGHDAGGANLPSGVYLARYRAGAAAGVRRLVRVE